MIGSAITLFTGRGIWFSGMRQVLFGLAAAAVLWLAGQVLPIDLAVVLSIATTVRLTGALHEDGLADADEVLRGRKLGAVSIDPGRAGGPADPPASSAQQQDQSH
mgnify:CR=1 FL=1